MQVKKVVISSVMGIGLGAMAFAGAGTASAEGGHGAPGQPGKSGGDVTITHTTTSYKNSFNTYDDHSVNVLNNLFSGNTVLSGNKTTISVANGNKFLNNLGSGANILNFNTNLKASLDVWAPVKVANGTKIGNGWSSKVHN